MRKLIILALGGAAAAYVMKNRGSEAAPVPSAGGFAPGPEPSAQPAVTETPDPGESATAETATAETVETDAIDPEARFGQTEHASTGEGVVPDTSDDDPLVRREENAAAAQAGSIGGPADTVTAGVDEEMRPVVEGSGDAEETFEETEDQGR
jgi:hypothetical protein